MRCSLNSQGTLCGTRVEESMTNEQVDNIYIVIRERRHQKNTKVFITALRERIYGSSRRAQHRRPELSWQESRTRIRALRKPYEKGW